MKIRKNFTCPKINRNCQNLSWQQTLKSHWKFGKPFAFFIPFFQKIFFKIDHCVVVDYWHINPSFTYTVGWGKISIIKNNNLKNSSACKNPWKVEKPNSMHSTFCYIFGLWHAGLLHKEFLQTKKISLHPTEKDSISLVILWPCHYKDSSGPWC